MSEIEHCKSYIYVSRIYKQNDHNPHSVSQSFRQSTHVYSKLLLKSRLQDLSFNTCSKVFSDKQTSLINISWCLTDIAESLTFSFQRDFWFCTHQESSKLILMQKSTWFIIILIECQNCLKINLTSKLITLLN